MTRVQDFGYHRSNHAGGAVGEIGGLVSRSLIPATYAKVIEPRTLNDRLRASGKLSVTESSGGSGVLVGWFNHASPLLDATALGPAPEKHFVLGRSG